MRVVIPKTNNANPNTNPKPKPNLIPKTYYFSTDVRHHGVKYELDPIIVKLYFQLGDIYLTYNVCYTVSF